MKMEVYRPVPILVKLFVDPPKVLQRPKWRHPHSNLDSSLVQFQERKFRFLKEFYGVHVAVMFSSGNGNLHVRNRNRPGVLFIRLAASERKIQRGTQI